MCAFLADVMQNRKVTLQATFRHLALHHHVMKDLYSTILSLSDDVEVLCHHLGSQVIVSMHLSTVGVWGHRRTVEHFSIYCCDERYAKCDTCDMFDVDNGCKGTLGHSAKFDKTRCNGDVKKHFFKKG